MNHGWHREGNHFVSLYKDRYARVKTRVRIRLLVSLKVMEFLTTFVYLAKPNISLKDSNKHFKRSKPPTSGVLVIS